ncbi:hypothetical protein PENARI_c051G09654 [Penicillium arizonense]|uniref:AB hydrolase-1 domain-containing protein n=1 Tax=Penicillium arizonense TaxID=1835702 RepID=A0A1F5L260_PENAI|nr:hypothetical protein PENARI_c051G09654 [Penicillium arizonense]OGE47294.1 hypothetical protein PENARI_c051G09654 [Penicillium arizonense]
MAGFPFSESDGVQYDGPTSGYQIQIADVEAGHWLISEKPEDFRQAVVKFLGSQ